MKRAMIDASQMELTDKVVTIKRVTKVVKGGRNMRFTALVVVGTVTAMLAAVWAKQLKFRKRSARAERTLQRILSA